MAAGLLIAASDIVLPVFADKNPQAECIKGQNEAFIGKEQSGDAYKSSKDTCHLIFERRIINKIGNQIEN
jgi:hypothetical protein